MVAHLGRNAAETGCFDLPVSSNAVQAVEQDTEEDSQAEHVRAAGAGLPCQLLGRSIQLLLLLLLRL